MKKSSISSPLSESDKIIQIKIEKALELICPLYNQKLITDAYIVGSIATGTANFYSDIDINLVNPLCEIHPSSPLYDLRPEIVESPNIKKIVDQFKNFGIEFKYIKRKDVGSWYQIYKNELFHIMLSKDVPKDIKSTIKPSFQITKDMCQWFI